MIAHITHGSDAGGVVDYLTDEVAEGNGKTAIEEAAPEAEQFITGSSKETDQSPQDDAGLTSIAGEHSQYPRQSRPDDLDDDYRINRRWRVIGGNLSENPKEAVRELENIISYRPDIKKPVWHASLSAHPTDKITTQRWREIAGRFLDEVELKNAPYLVIQHRDQEQDHVHIVTSRVDVFGNVNDAWRERRRGQIACVKIEEEYGAYYGESERSLRVKMNTDYAAK